MKSLLAKKIGMTQIFLEDGRALPVTVLDISGNVVVQKKSIHGKDGYTAVKIGFGEIHKHEKDGETPVYRLNNPRVGVFTKLNLEPKRHLIEFRVSEEELEGYEVGATLTADTFRVGQYVDVSGKSKGRGFAGVMKRHNFGGARTATHGTHEYFRHAGSIGASADPARVFPGTRMAGHYGAVKATVQNIMVVEVINDENLILVKGGIPGPNGGLIHIRTASKRAKAVGTL